MKSTTAQRFGSLGKSFASPSAAAAVIGAALLASGTTDTAETAWSPAAACLLPDVLPVSGTLLSYGGSRQLAAGGTVSHSGSLNIGSASDTNDTGGVITIRRWRHPSLILSANTAQGSFWGLALQITGTEKAGLKVDSNSGEVRLNVGSGGYYPTIYSNGVQRMVINTAGDTTFAGAITASGAVTVTSGSVISNTGMFQALASGQNMFLLNSAGTSYGSIGNDAGDKWSLGYKASSSTALGTPVLTWTVAGFVGINKVSPTVALDVTGAITASGLVTVDSLCSSSLVHPSRYVYLNSSAMYPGSNNMGLGTSGNPWGASYFGAITASGAIQETPTQSSLNPTTTDIPSGKRMGWYNSTLSEFRDWVNIGGTLLKSAAYT